LKRRVNVNPSHHRGSTPRQARLGETIRTFGTTSGLDERKSEARLGGMHYRTGIIAAMESEFRDLADSLDHDSSEKIAGREILYGTLEGENVALVLCGCGKVNATHAATLMACRTLSPRTSPHSTAWRGRPGPLGRAGI
jgi:hypothetical protein